MRDREVHVVGARAELGADLPVGRGHDAEQTASEDGDGEVVPVHCGLALSRYMPTTCGTGARGTGRRVWAVAGTAVPTRVATPRARATNVLRICKVVGSFRFGRVGARGRLQAVSHICLIVIRHFYCSRHAGRLAEVPSSAGPNVMSLCTRTCPALAGWTQAKA